MPHSIRFLPFVLSCVLAGTAHALIIEGDESQSTTAPADDFGFANVGNVFASTDGIPASGIYLGNGWMISAYHVVRDSAADGGFSFGSVVLNGLSYSIDSSSGVRLTNANQTPADLALFRLTTIPNLPSVSISASAPAVGTSVILSGNGYERAATQTQWNVNTTTNPYTWTQISGTGNAQGYQWVYSQTIRWGTNNISSYQTNVSDGYGTLNMVLTNFSSNTPGEAQAVPGDSGGGLFYKIGSTWELGGILIGDDSYSGQPTGTSVYGNSSYAADLTSYRSQIMSVIPEPRTGALAALSAVGLLSRRRRKA